MATRAKGTGRDVITINDIKNIDDKIKKFPAIVEALSQKKNYEETAALISKFKTDMNGEGITDQDIDIILAMKNSLGRINLPFSSVIEQTAAFLKKYRDFLHIKVTCEEEMDEFFMRFSYCFGKETGIKIYIVGGYVRDKITGFPSKDIDVDMTDKIKEFSDLFIIVATMLIPGNTFGMDNKIKNIHLECGQLKLDGFDINFKPDVLKALSESDFTINGIGIDLSPGISSDAFAAFARNIVYGKALEKKHYDKLIYPDKSYLDDAVNKVFRISPYQRMHRGINVSTRALKFFERSFEDYDKSGFTFDKGTLSTILVNSGYSRFAINRKLMRLLATVDREKISKNPHTAGLVMAAESYRSSGAARDLEGFLKYLLEKGYDTTQERAKEAFRISFSKAYVELEKFILSESNVKKNAEGFINYLRKNNFPTDHYGEKELLKIFENLQDDPKLSPLKQAKDNLGQHVGTLIKTISGTGKWLDDFKGDNDERVYKCLKFFNESTRSLTYMFEHFNIENLRMLKVSDKNKYLAASIRIAAMLADTKPEALESEMSKIKLTTTLKDFERALIPAVVRCSRILLALSNTFDSDEMATRKLFLHMYDEINRVRGKKGWSEFLQFYNVPEEIIDCSARIISACNALKGTKYQNSVFSSADLGRVQKAQEAFREFMNDKQQIEYFLSDYLPLEKSDVYDTFEREEIREFFALFRKHKIETPGILSKADALKFLQSVALNIKERVASRRSAAAK